MKTETTNEKPVKKLFGGGWQRPIIDEFGNKWCNCLIPNLRSHYHFEEQKGQAYCLRCKCNYYH